MRLQHYLALLFFAAVPLFHAHGDTLDINVNQVQVYAEPSENSEVLTTLDKGTSVPLAKKTYDGFYKVKAEVEGTRRIGYIKIADLRGRSKRGQKKKKRSPVYFTRDGIGLLLGLNYTTQGGHRYTDPAGASSVDISTLSGLSNQLGFFFDLPVNETMAARIYLLFKQANVTGSSTILAASPKPTDTFLNQSFLSLGGTWKFYGTRSSSTWWGPGFQLDKGTSGSLKFGSSSTQLESSELPNFYFLYLAGGYDWMLSKSWSLQIEARLGAIPNAKPMIFEGDLNLGVAYSFDFNN